MTLGTGTLGSGTLGNPGTTTTSSGGRFVGFTQRQIITGRGRLHVTVTLHGEGEPFTIAGSGRLRTTTALIPLLSATSRLRSSGALLATSGRLRSNGHLAPVLQAFHPRLKDPADLWLALDLPELA